MNKEKDANLIHHTYRLSNDVEIPKIGFGTWKIKDGKETYDSVTNALKIGYRHIDTATVYGNEKSVGKAIKDSGIARDSLFVTTKLPADIKGFDSTFVEFDKSLKRLGLEYIDLYLIHAPWPWNDIGRDYTHGNIESWKVMIKLYQKKRVRAIGVSNFSVDDIKSLIAATGFVPHVNQIPFYVGKPQKELREYCCQNNILVEAYSPLMSGRIFKIKLLDELATKYNVTPAQIALRYTIEQGTLPLPKSTHIERMKENIALDFDLQIADVESLGNIGLKSKSRFL